jgi:hypothetical protein
VCPSLGDLGRASQQVYIVHTTFNAWLFKGKSDTLSLLRHVNHVPFRRIVRLGKVYTFSLMGARRVVNKFLVSFFVLL